MQRILNYIANNPTGSVIASSLIVLALGIIDWLTGYELSFQFIYFIPLALFASNPKINQAIIVLFAFLTSLVWFLADYYNDHVYSQSYLYAWNTMSRSIIFIAYSLFLNSTVRHRQKIESLNKELLKKDLIVTDSIKYAKTIQDSIVPAFISFNTIFPDSFIINKPKDILSGDFFWYHKRKNLVFFASVDCTGHGVPGSLLSIIGIIAIHRAIIGKELNSPDEILKNMHFEVENIFITGNGNIDDGLEISLGVFDQETNNLCIAQTTQGMLLINPAGQTTIFESNGFTIGGLLSKRKGPNYTSNTIKIEKGSSLYLFTDGYIDQFGSSENIKFGYENFTTLTKTVQHNTSVEQCATFTDTINQWKGNKQQTDDMLVVGITFS